jgi:23S rRNA (cytidine1920-2'-O)/16S rRNA (cytidine1409-2'-O)-methyltransferase
VATQLTPEGEMVVLVKPQFEVPPADAPKGVVLDQQVRRDAVDLVRRHAESIGLDVRGELESPLSGPAGNREYLLHLARA